MNYDDMMGLDGMTEIFSPEVVKDHLIGMSAGAGAIMLVGYTIPKIPVPASWTPENQVRLRAGISVAAGLVAGRAMYDYNRDAAMAIVGGVSGLGLARLVSSFFGTTPLNGYGMLPEEMELSAMSDEALLAAYDDDGAMNALEELAAYGDDGAMNALAELEATNVQSHGGAFSGPTVTNQPLFGLNAPVVQMETLGAYSPYMA